MYAARQGAIASARALADAGADLNFTDLDGTSPLVLAIMNAHYEFAAMLLEKAADPNVADEAGMAPLYAAVDMHTQRWMFGRPLPKLTGAMTAADMVKRLLAHGADPNARLKRPILMRQGCAWCLASMSMRSTSSARRPCTGRPYVARTASSHSWRNRAPSWT
jgi:ankyrin repeat protein